MKDTIKINVGDYIALPGGVLAEVTKLDAFGATQHVGFYGRNTLYHTPDTQYFSGWMPLLMVEQSAKHISRDQWLGY